MGVGVGGRGRRGGGDRVSEVFFLQRKQFKNNFFYMGGGG